MIFKNLSIRNKLILSSLIAMLGLLYYLSITVRQELAQRDAARDALRLVTSMENLSGLLHEIQKERGFSIAYLSSSGVLSKEELLAQWESTDRIIRAIEPDMLLTTDTYLDSSLDSLTLIRKKTMALSSPASIDEFYLTAKSRLLDKMTSMGRLAANPMINNSAEEHLYLLHAKDFLSQLRTDLSNAIYLGRLTQEEYADIARTKGKHDAFLDYFKKTASAELHHFFQAKFENPLVLQTYDVVQGIMQDPESVAGAIENDLWWAISTYSINALQEVENFSTSMLQQQARQIVSASETNVVSALATALFISVLVMFAMVLTIRNITEALTSIRLAADNLAKGNTSVMVDVKSKDEIGEVAFSFNKMIAATRRFAESAQAIGKGQYTSEIDVRSEVDTLGLALNLMKASLKQLSEENAARTWLLSGNAELNDTLRGEKEIGQLAQDIITFLSRYLDAQVGALYVRSGDQLELNGSFAFRQRKGRPHTFRIGEALVGQAALEKRSILISEVPSGYLNIESGIGYTQPRFIFIFPFLYEAELKGIIELGFVKDISEESRQFLELTSSQIGIAFNVAESRARQRALLEETQRQAEELEAQQEELRQANDELNAKTNLLEESELELKTQKDELEQTNEELEQKATILNEQKHELEEAKHQLEEKAKELELTGRYKSEFLANMSHELRTPLNSIVILSKLLSENQELACRDADFARNINTAGNDLLNLINEILDLSKIEAGKIELEMEEVALDDICESMNRTFTEIANERKIQFTSHLENSLSGKTIYSDQQRLEQILKNLLSNAFKFTGAGGKVGLTVTLAPESKSYQHAALTESKRVVAIAVSDSGIGIPEEKQQVIFEAFQQADGSTKRNYGGTGLGLSISRQLATALGGEIKLASKTGEGSVFTLFLPLDVQVNESYNEKFTPAANPALPPALSILSRLERFSDDRDTITKKDRVVLIIEDDIKFASLLLTLVRQKGYKGILAHTGNSGLSQARQSRPDAVLLDLKLPVMPGIDVLRHLKADPDLRHVPVVIISALEKKYEGLSLGAFEFVRKPVSVDALQSVFDKIEEFVSRRYKNLLVVEDNEQQNKAICELIGNGDVKCFPVFSGQEAIRMLGEQKFDCIIVDLGLPDIKGFDLLQTIKANPLIKQIPIVVYTGKDLTRQENIFLSRLANSVILKTVRSMERLLDETTLFLHRVEANLPKEKQHMIHALRNSDDTLKGKTVLLADDDMRNIYSLTNALESKGIHCVVAENGIVALEKLRQDHEIDLILMDVMMPGMDGLETTRAIRKLPEFSLIPIIALTAKAMKGDKEKCLNAGMSDYISKPIDIDHLLMVMRTWLPENKAG